MFDQSPKEMMEIAAEHYGRRGAGILYHLGVLAFVCTAVGIIGAFLLAANTYVVSPALGGLGTLDLGQYGLAVLSISVSVVLFATVGFLAKRQAKRLVKVLFETIDYRIDAKVSGITKRAEAINTALSELVGQVSDLQIHTGTHPLVKILVERKTALAIHFARYGINNTVQGSVDVKEKVESHIKGNRIEILVSNETLGCHPFYNQHKRLFVTYSIGPTGEHKHVEVDESHPLVIPEPPMPPSSKALSDVRP